MSDQLNVRQTAEILGVHENTIRNWIKSGLLDESSFARLPSGVVRFNREKVQQMRDEMWSGFAPATEMPGQRPTQKGGA